MGGSPKMSWGSGVKNLTARIAPDMLGGKMGTKMVPVRALKAPSTISRAKFRGDAIRDDGRSPNPFILVQNGRFPGRLFLSLFSLILVVPLTNEKLPSEESQGVIGF